MTTATFISPSDLKTVLGISDSAQDTLLQSLCDSVESLWEEKTGRNWVEGERTEYFDSAAYTMQLFLKNKPVASSPAIQIWDDPDWSWSDSHKIDNSDFRVDYVKGIIHYNGYFYEGKQSVKVVYTSGYSLSTVPDWLKKILIRQACHWYKQDTDQRWDKSSVAAPAGGGTISYKNLKNNLLPEFVELAEENSD